MQAEWSSKEKFGVQGSQVNVSKLPASPVKQSLKATHDL